MGRGGVGILILQVAVRSVIGAYLPQRRKIVFFMRSHAGKVPGLEKELPTEAGERESSMRWFREKKREKHG